MRAAKGERRKGNRIPRFLRQQIELSYSLEPGSAPLTTAARLLDWSDDGWGVELRVQLPVGMAVSLSGDSLRAAEGGDVHARVIWCEAKGSLWRIGLAKAAPQEPPKPPPISEEPVNADHYEVLQLSSNADQEMIHRVYRLLAQRYHPDNQETGSIETFKQVLDAYRTLGDPEKRAAYDAAYQAMRRLRWKIFDQPNAAQGAQGERRKRHGILALLYSKRLNQPDQPSVSLLEIEDLLGVPREHLEFCFWYLKESGLVVRSDNGRYAITLRGVDEFEKADSASDRHHLLLTPGPTTGPSAA